MGTYQQQSSTILANVLLKETINEYIAAKSSVFSCFIALSKAFERVNHAMLIDKLKCKSVPCFIVEIFQNIFRGSNMSVYWQGIRSKECMHVEAYVNLEYFLIIYLCFISIIF